MKIHISRLSVVPIALLATSVFAASKPQIQWDPDYDFSQVGTFAWQPSAGESLEQSDPFLHEHIINTIEFQLTSHGLTEVDSNPDVLVTYYSSTDTNVRLDSTTFGYGFGGYGRGSWGYYGYGMRGPVVASTSTRVVEYERGTLVIDIIDPGLDELVWRGTVSDIVISDNPQKMQKNITKAIEKMAKQADKLRRREERRR
ncbi:MAG: DUF4136 domain-containing protein [Gammaproteobacteria bacterium]|jgi:hypothetical protein